MTTVKSITEQLREMDAHDTPAHANVLMQEAADEIEKLSGYRCPCSLTPGACRESACDQPKQRHLHAVPSDQL